MFTIALLASASTWADADNREQRGPMVVYTAEAGFDEAKDALKEGIVGQGIVISNELHASDMLNRTGPDLGITENVYLQATTFEFCSSALSHALVAADPANMMACPYAIGLYVLTKDPVHVHMAYRNPQGTPGTEATTDRIQALLEAIISEALDFL
jgi:uncharacterized protein (DUF302 family)